MLIARRDCKRNLEGLARMVRNLDGERARDRVRGRLMQNHFNTKTQGFQVSLGMI